MSVSEEVLHHLNIEDYSTQNDVKAIRDDAKEEFLEIVYYLDQAQLDEVIRYKITSRGVDSKSPRWEVPIHLANHSTDPRSQILAMMHQQFGIKTIEQDMIFFRWGEDHE